MKSCILVSVFGVLLALTIYARGASPAADTPLKPVAPARLLTAAPAEANYQPVPAYGSHALSWSRYCYGDLWADYCAEKKSCRGLMRGGLDDCNCLPNEAHCGNRGCDSCGSGGRLPFDALFDFLGGHPHHHHRCDCEGYGQAGPPPQSPPASGPAPQPALTTPPPANSLPNSPEPPSEPRHPTSTDAIPLAPPASSEGPGREPTKPEIPRNQVPASKRVSQKTSWQAETVRPVSTRLSDYIKTD